MLATLLGVSLPLSVASNYHHHQQHQHQQQLHQFHHQQAPLHPQLPAHPQHKLLLGRAVREVLGREVGHKHTLHA